MADRPGKGTVIAHVECGGCGKRVNVTLNVNSIAYYFCSHVNDSGQPCAHHERWGREDSNRMIDQYMAAKGKSDGAAPSKEDDTRNRPDGHERGGNWLVG